MYDVKSMLTQLCPSGGKTVPHLGCPSNISITIEYTIKCNSKVSLT